MLSATTHSIDYKEKDVQGKVEFVLDPNIGQQISSIRSTDAKMKCTIQLFDTHVLAPYRFMFEKISQRGEGDYGEHSFLPP